MRPAVKHCFTYINCLLTFVVCVHYSYAQPTRLPRFDHRLCAEGVRLAIRSTIDSVRRDSAGTADSATVAAFMAKLDGHQALSQVTLSQVQTLTSGVDGLLSQLRLQSNRSEQDIVTATARISSSIQQPLQKLTATTYNMSTQIEKLPENFRIIQQSSERASLVLVNISAQIRGNFESLHDAAACVRAERLMTLSNETLTLFRGLPTILQSMMMDYTADSRAHLKRVLDNATSGAPNFYNGMLNQSCLNAPALLLSNQTYFILKNQTASIARLLNLASTVCDMSNRTIDRSARIALQSDQLSQKVDQMLSLLGNLSRTTATIMERQLSFETYAVVAPELPPVDFNATTSVQTIVNAMLRDIDSRLDMQISSSHGLLRNGSVPYLMPKKLTYYDIAIKYLINSLQAIDRKMEQPINKNSSCQSSVEPPFVGYEDAKRSATARASTVRPQERRTVVEIQAFSEYLSPAYSGFHTAIYYTGCQDAYSKGVRTPGIYHFSFDGSLPFRAWCDFDAAGGWMVMQRRLDGTVDFFRRWTDYEKGFGNLWGEYWLGLQKIYLLTRRTISLSIYMEAFDGQFAWANYSSFRIGDVSSQYTLSVGNYNGSAGDSFSGQSGHKFSTWDRDNDIYNQNCAHLYMGAWWYSSCHGSNLNGRYEIGTTASYATANCWQSFKGYYYGLKVTMMRIHA